MSIRDELVLLAEIALLDVKLKDSREKLKSLPQKADIAKQQLEIFTRQHESLHKQKTELLVKRKQFDADLQTERGNLRKWESRADKIKGERDYAALQSEISAQKRVIGDLETKISELQTQLDAVSSQVEKATEQAKKAEETAEQEWAHIKAEVEECESKVNSISASRDVLLKKLPPIIANRYTKIAEKRLGIGVAFVKKEVCQACSRMLPPELYLRVMRAEVVEQCPSCQRILVGEEIAHQVTATA